MAPSSKCAIPPPASWSRICKSEPSGAIASGAPGSCLMSKRWPAPGLAGRPSTVHRDLRPEDTSWLDTSAMARGTCPPAATTRRLRLPRRPRSQNHRLYHPAQQERPPLQVELRRRRRARPMPRPAPAGRHRPPGSRVITTHGNCRPRNLRCAALAEDVTEAPPRPAPRSGTGRSDAAVPRCQPADPAQVPPPAARRTALPKPCRDTTPITRLCVRGKDTRPS